MSQSAGVSWSPGQMYTALAGQVYNISYAAAAASAEACLDDPDVDGRDCCSNVHMPACAASLRSEAQAH